MGLTVDGRGRARFTCDRCGRERECFRTGATFADPYDGRPRTEFCCAECLGLDEGGGEVTRHDRR